jgi:Phage portal protein
MPRMSTKLKHAWNAFQGFEQPNRNRVPYTEYYGASTGRRPDRPVVYISNERSIISSIYTRIGIDAAGILIEHCRTDDDGRYQGVINSNFNNCLSIEANIDQAATQFRQDLIMTLLEVGTAAIVPVDTTLNPLTGGGWDINTMRVGEIVTWYPKYVRVRLYDEAVGLKKELVLPKSMIGIVENPLYSIMNEQNSTMKRLGRKLQLLDAVDEQSGSGKLDMIIQLPYVIKSEARRQQAEQRRTDIEFQLSGSKYGIAYTDGTEKITQLNRSVTNNLMDQVTYLTGELYSELGLTTNVMNGTAAEPEMLNYWNRTIEPIIQSVVEEMKRKFLTKTARTQNQSVVYFRDVFKLIPLGGDGGIADIADKFSRNEILSPNELRQAIGYKPSLDPSADKLQNSNMPKVTERLGADGQPLPAPVDDPNNPGKTLPTTPGAAGTTAPVADGSAAPSTDPADPSTSGVMSQSFDQIDNAINGAFSDLGVDDGTADATP